MFLVFWLQSLFEKWWGTVVGHVWPVRCRSWHWRDGHSNYYFTFYQPKQDYSHGLHLRRFPSHKARTSFLHNCSLVSSCPSHSFAFFAEPASLNLVLTFPTPRASRWDSNRPEVRWSAWVWHYSQISGMKLLLFIIFYASILGIRHKVNQSPHFHILFH